MERQAVARGERSQPPVPTPNTKSPEETTETSCLIIELTPENAVATTVPKINSSARAYFIGTFTPRDTPVTQPHIPQRINTL